MGNFEKYKIKLILLYVLYFLATGQKIAETCPPANTSDADVRAKGWVLTVHIKGAHSEEEFRIFTKEQFAKKDVERGILILQLVPNGTVASSQDEQKEIGDKIVYFKYKENTDRPTKIDMYHWFHKYRRIRRLDNVMMERDKFLPFEFTYYDLINAVKKLVHKDKLKLGGDTFSVTKRDAEELPDSVFFLGRRYRSSPSQLPPQRNN